MAEYELLVTGIGGQGVQLGAQVVARAAALEGRDTISDGDIVQAAEIALPHRLKRRLFQEGEVEAEHLEVKLDQVKAKLEHAMPASGSADTGKKKP